MGRTIILDSVEPTQVILAKDPATGKVLVQAAYRVKAGNEIAKIVPGRVLTYMPGPGRGQQTADLMTIQEQAYASAAWDAVAAALRRAELG